MISVTIGSPDMDSAGHWDDLIARAPVNVFMSPVALCAAAATGFAKIHVLHAWDRTAVPQKLVGVWALQERRPLPLWPRVLEALPFNYSFLSRPVIDPAFTDEVMSAFLAAIRDAPALPNVFSIKDMDAEALSYAALEKEAGASGRAPLVLQRHVRPVVSRQSGVKSSGSTRKKLRQDWNRLSAAGALEVVHEREASAVRHAFEIFLKLEMASWKGSRGTALLCDSRDSVFVRRLIGDLAEQGCASVALLRLDGRIIAAQVVLQCGNTAYTWKTAFDADFARYSPGVLLIDKLTEQLFAATPIEAIDSCSAEGGFMTQLWSGRRIMVDLLLDVGTGRSLAFGLEAARQLGFRELKALRNRLRGLARRPAKKRSVAVQ